jgi:outer membrane receptor protein involved in Fe transport
MRRPSGSWMGAGVVMVSLWAALAGSARAQDVALPEPAGPTPAPSKELRPDDVAIEGAPDIDLANLVTSAAKGLSTVQEAPSIVTVITSEDLERRGIKFLNQALATIPGWMETSMIGTSLPMPMVRGVQQAALLLHDGISMFEPWGNWGSFNRSQPIESLKRLEVVTGPGGVLWGANSFLGVINLISKDAEDVNGLEVSAGYGDGPGNKQDFRAYALFGKTFFNGKLKLFQHLSYESYLGAVWRLPQSLTTYDFGPQYGPDPERSWLVTIDGKYSLGPIILYYSVPLGVTSTQMNFLPAAAAHGTMTMYDRYAILEYRRRFWGERLSFSAKGYYTQFVRDSNPQAYPTSPLFPAFVDANGKYSPGGLYINASGLVQRFGALVDGDITLPHEIRLLGGVETFNESVNGLTSRILSPAGGGYLGYRCPLGPDGVQVPQCPGQATANVDRTVVAGYVDAQWRPLARLTFDAGVRLQQAFGKRPYSLTPLYSAAVSWNFWQQHHIKVNYTTGFRPPVFNNTDATPGGINWAGDPHLRNENSQALQAELNTRVLRNVGIFREVELRIDYAYTVLNNLIEILGQSKSAIFTNDGARSIHSVEAQGRAYLVGEHFVELSYTYLHAQSSTIGVVHNVPSHWVGFTGSVNVIHRMLDFNAGLNFYAVYDDPNLYPAARGSVPGSTTTTAPTGVTFDRLGPVALVQVGAHLRLWSDRLGISAQLYNALNQRYWVPDAINEVRPNSQTAGTPGPGISFFASVRYRPF